MVVQNKKTPGKSFLDDLCNSHCLTFHDNPKTMNQFNNKLDINFILYLNFNQQIARKYSQKSIVVINILYTFFHCKRNNYIVKV